MPVLRAIILTARTWPTQPVVAVGHAGTFAGMRRRRTLAALIWASLLTAGCSSGIHREATPSTTGAPSATTLVTPTTLPEVAGIGPADLLAAPVPSLCQHPPGTLVDGRLPGIPAHDGQVRLAWGYEQRPTTVAVGDLDGEPGAEIAAVFICNRGGVPWANSVQIYRPGPTLLASVTLSDLVPDDVGRAVVRDLTYEHGRLFIRWLTGQDGDGGCCSTLDAHAHLHLSGTDVVVDDVTSFPEGQAVERILAAVTSGDRATLDRVSGGKPAIADRLARLLVGSTGFGSVTCRGAFLLASDGLVPSPVSGDRSCEVERLGTTPAHIGLDNTGSGNGDWTVVDILPR